jgi:hypothetical protein
MGPVSSSAVRLIGLLLTIGVSSGSVVLAQLRMTDKGPTFQSVQQIASIVGSDSDAAVVVSQAIAGLLEPKGTRTVTVFESQVLASWLPVVPGVEFVRMGDAEVKSHYAGCGRYLWLSVNRTNDRLEVTVGEGNKCGGAGQGMPFKRTPAGWVRDFSGLGSGFASGGSHCECR